MRKKNTTKLFFKIFIVFIEASKTARSNIYRLVLEPDEDDDSVRLDFRMLAEQAIPIELRQWVKILMKKTLMNISSIEF